MSCGSACGTKESGCGSSGGCSSGGCNKNNVFDWFSFMPLSYNENYAVVEISFKKGARKGFYRNSQGLDLFKGQLVVVEAAQGFDIGEVSLQGELVKPQMKKRKVSERADTIRNIIRLATEEDIDLFLDGRNRENEAMVRARAIAHSHKVEMKIGDVEYQGDGKKLTIYYIADGRVDFRELVKVYAKEFKVKIEMRQIGARQEAARIGGVGTCGRELCCSTWLQDFKSVTTQAVRYQNLAINTEKMSGQCGRLKCCLNYELDTYNDALKKFPKNADKIETSEGTAILRKTEILKKEMWYSYEKSGGSPVKLSVESVQQLLWMNKQGEKPESLANFAIAEEKVIDESKHEDLVGHVNLQALEQKHRKNRNKHKKQSQRSDAQQSNQQKQTAQKPQNKPQQKQHGKPQQKPSAQQTIEQRIEKVQTKQQNTHKPKHKPQHNKNKQNPNANDK